MTNEVEQLRQLGVYSIVLKILCNFFVQLKAVGQAGYHSTLRIACSDSSEDTTCKRGEEEGKE